MIAKWYVRQGSWQQGPFTLSQLQEMAAAGRLSPETQVQPATGGDWSPALYVPQLFPNHPRPALPETTEFLTAELNRSSDQANPQPTSTAEEVVPPPLPRSQTLDWQKWAIGVGSLAVLLLLATVVYVVGAKSRQQQRELASQVARVELAIVERDLPAAQAALVHWESLAKVLDKNWQQQRAGMQQRISLLQSELAAEALWERAGEALAAKQFPAAADWLEQHLAHEHGQHKPTAQEYLREIRTLLDVETLQKQMIAWTDEQLAAAIQQQLLTALPPLRNPVLQQEYQTAAIAQAKQEADKREQVKLARIEAEKKLAAEEKARVAAAEAALAREKAEAEQKQLADQIARRKAAREQLAADRAAWQADVNAHGSLRLIPGNALAAVGTNHLANLDQKLGDFMTEIGLPKAWVDVLRASTLFAEVPAEKGFDHQGPLAFILVSPDDADVDRATMALNLELFSKLAVVVIRTNNLADVCKFWNLHEAGLREGRVVKSDLIRGLLPFQRAVAYHDKMLFISLNPAAAGAAAEHFRNGQSVVKVVHPQDGRMLVARDLLVYVGTTTWGPLWARIVTSLESGFQAGTATPEAQQTWEGFVETARHTRYAAAGINLNRALQVRAVAGFSEHDDVRIERFLETLNAGDDTPTMDGLPHEHALWSFAARGDGPANVVLAHLTFQAVWHQVLTDKRFAVAPNQVKHGEKFAAVWRHINSARGALYHVAGDDRLGQFATVGSLETNDPAVVIQALRDFVQTAEEAAAEAAQAAGAAQQLHFSMFAEEFEGRSTWVLAVADERPPEAQAGLRQALGLHYSQLRIIPFEKSMLVFIGSDLNLLRQAIRNQLDQRPGLAENPAIVEALRQHGPERKIQLAVSAAGSVAVNKDPQQLYLPLRYSSMSLGISTTRIQVDVEIPTAELKAVIAAQN